VLVFLPYIAPYENFNNELSRVLANAILISNWCNAITFKNIRWEEYNFAYNAIYELWDVQPLKKIFISEIRNWLL
jgi:hypothetical protein